MPENPTTVRLDEDVKAAVKEEAEITDRSVNYIINRVLREWARSRISAAPARQQTKGRKAQ